MYKESAKFSYLLFLCSETRLDGLRKYLLKVYAGRLPAPFHQNFWVFAKFSRAYSPRKAVEESMYLPKLQVTFSEN